MSFCVQSFSYYPQRESWENEKKSVGYTQTSSMLTKLKKEISWLKESDSIALQQSLRNLDTAYQNFFKKDRNYPKYKSKKNHRQTYRTMGIRIEGGRIKLPKVGLVKFEQSRKFQGKILSATITRTATEKYFVSLCVEEEIADNLKINQGGEIGLDVGLKEFYTDSFGRTVSNPQILKRLTVKLCREQRRLSKKIIGSNNRNKQRIKVARVHEKISNARLDFLHKETTRLCRENQTIAVESLQVKNLMKNHKLAKAISDASWGEFFRQLSYKSILYGCDLIKIPTFYPSSQTCSCCGFKNPLTKNLSVRSWHCPKCRTIHERDLNAAKNILQKALEIKTTVGHTGSYACGERVRPKT